MDSANIRRERIERLLHELEYEITRGVMDREIEPRMGLIKILPGGPTGTVMLRFEIRPMRRDDHQFSGIDLPRLRVVGDPASEGGLRRCRDATKV